ncbi:MAG: hypothetical protein ABFS34_05960 [Gemmatimonadota bacterium]
MALARQGSAHYRASLPSRAHPDAPLAELLQSLPILEREKVQQAADAVRIVGYRGRTSTKTTGGSTGQAVCVVKNADAVARERAASWLGHGWFGVRSGDRNVRFWGGATTLSRGFASVAADIAMNRSTFPAFAFDDDRLAQYWSRCRSIRPRYVYGYVSMLEEFARFLLRNDLSGSELGIRVVITTAEVLAESQRRLISDAFGAPVQNEYGCGEVGPIAYGCPAGSLHIMAENVIVETVDADGWRVPDGEPGEILVTDLGNDAMPLIRYRLGDSGTLGQPCSCGRAWPVLLRIWGRAYDFVADGEGRKYHGEFFMYLFEDLRHRGVRVDQFQVRQSAEGALCIHLRQSGADGAVDTLERVRREAAKRLPGMPITVRWVGEIPRESSGKLRLIVNESGGSPRGVGR